MIDVDSLKLFFATLIEAVILAWIISRLVTFIPNLLYSVIRKLRNDSPIYSEPTIYPANVNSELDKSDLGSKTFIDRWLEKIR